MSELTSLDFHRVTPELSYVVVHEPLSKQRPGNGGLRFLPYATEAQMVADAYELNRRMSVKHRLHGTGFSGAKVVARGVPTQANKERLLTHLADTLNGYDGRLYTGCDLNTNEADMAFLASRTPFVLAGLGVSVDASRATGTGVFASAEAVSDRGPLRYLVHGVGAVGAEVVDRLVAAGHRVATVDRLMARACRAGATVIDPDGAWWREPFDVLVLCSASGLITPEMACELSGQALVSGANAPFSDEHSCKAILRQRGIRWIHDAVCSGGAVIVDSVERYAPYAWSVVDADSLYTLVYESVFELSHQFLSCGDDGLDDDEILAQLLARAPATPVGECFAASKGLLGGRRWAG